MEASALEGCGTALVTPFQRDGSIDEGALQGLLDEQLEGNIDFLVPCGTTGEAPTLTPAEQERVVAIVAARAAGRVPVLAGAGGNNTRHVIELARRLIGAGADGLLSVTPYYNKPDQAGLYEHYATLACEVPRPWVLYNVPGRTSVNLLPETVLRFAALENIVGIKEASGDMIQIERLAARMPDGFRLLSGDDAMVLPLIAVGGHGVISVVANLAPKWMVTFTRACLDGDFATARQSQPRLLELVAACFLTTNPIPVKAALALMERIEPIYRLPLTPMAEDQRQRLRRTLADAGLLAARPAHPSQPDVERR